MAQSRGFRELNDQVAKPRSIYNTYTYYSYVTVVARVEFLERLKCFFLKLLEYHIVLYIYIYILIKQRCTLFYTE